MTAYRNDVDALAARHAALSEEIADKRRELADATRLLEDARARARLPVLDDIRIAAPCSASWAAMSGDERVRACGDCNKRVYNLSALTRDEAEALIIEKEGRLCVRYFQRTDGTILLKDCVIGVRRRRRRRVVAAGAAALLAGGGLVMQRADDTDAPRTAPEVMMGGIRVQYVAPVRPRSPSGLDDGMALTGAVAPAYHDPRPAHDRPEVGKPAPTPRAHRRR